MQHYVYYVQNKNTHCGVLTVCFIQQCTQKVTELQSSLLSCLTWTETTKDFEDDATPAAAPASRLCTRPRGQGLQLQPSKSPRKANERPRPRMCKNGRSLAWQLPESSTTKTRLAASVLIWIPTPMGASFSAAMPHILTKLLKFVQKFNVGILEVICTRVVARFSYS